MSWRAGDFGGRERRVRNRDFGESLGGTAEKMSFSWGQICRFFYHFERFPGFLSPYLPDFDPHPKVYLTEVHLWMGVKSIGIK